MIDNARSLVYGYLPDQLTLAFADDETAAEEAAELTALAAATTLGQARAVPVRHLRSNPAAPEYDDGADHEPFALAEVGAVLEGDWPGMTASRALTLLPKDLQVEYGTPTDTTLNGDYLEIPVVAEDGLVAALRERGHRVRRDDTLLNVLDGATLRGQTAW